MENEMKRYKIIGNQICLFYEGNYLPFANALRITKVINVTDSDTAIHICIKYLDFFDKKKSITITPSVISNKMNLLKLADKGMDVNDENIKQIQGYLYYSLNEERNYQIINNHTKLGFDMVNNKLVFKHYNLIANDEVNKVIEHSTYSGLLNLKPNGKFEDYRTFLREEIRGSTTLQLAVALSLTSPILWIVSEFEVEMESMVINLAGKSSSGKSTMLMLMTSLWGECQVTSNHSSLIKNWNSTSNALLKEISNDGYQGMPIALDEVGMSNIKDFSKFIYTISSGMDKKRLTSSSQLMDSGIFKTCVISSGELTMRDNIKNKTIGSNLIRLIEFHNVQWTDSAEQSNKIKAFVSKNFGTFAPAFIECILENVEVVIENWKIYVDEIKTRVIEKVGSGFGERIAMKFGLILDAYYLMMLMLDLEVEASEELIIQMLLDTLEDQDIESDLSRKAYDCIMNEFVENNNNYIKFKDPRYIQKEFSNNESNLARIYGKYCYKEYVITRERFENVLRKHGFKDIKGILIDWQEKDIIVSEQTTSNRKNPYNRRVIIGQSKVPVVVIRKNNVYEDETDEVVERVAQNEKVDIKAMVFEDEKTD